MIPEPGQGQGLSSPIVLASVPVSVPIPHPFFNGQHCIFFIVHVPLLDLGAFHRFPCQSNVMLEVPSKSK